MNTVAFRHPDMMAFRHPAVTSLRRLFPCDGDRFHPVATHYTQAGGEVQHWCETCATPDSWPLFDQRPPCEHEGCPQLADFRIYLHDAGIKAQGLWWCQDKVLCEEHTGEVLVEDVCDSSCGVSRKKR